MNKKAAKKKCAVKMAVKKARKTKDAVRRRLARVKENDPALPLPKFVERVNEIAQRYLPPGDPADRRLAAEFNERNVRNYQSKGLIDSPEKEGKEARYRYRHILQAVLIRVMLADGFRVPKIREMLAGKTSADFETLLDLGPLVARKMARDSNQSDPSPSPKNGRSVWARLEIAPGIEIHLSRHAAIPSSKEEGMQIREKISLALRDEFQRRRRRARRSEE